MLILNGIESDLNSLLITIVAGIVLILNGIESYTFYTRLRRVR